MMNTLVIKIIILLCFMFSFPISAESSWCEMEEEHQHEDIITNENNGMVTTKKFISYHKGSHTENDHRKEIVTIHDKKGNLVFSKEYTYIGKKLVQTIDDGVVRNIVQGKTPCHVTIVEPSGDSIFSLLDIKKEPEFDFIHFFYGHNIRFPENDIKYDIHDAIIYHCHFRCKEYHETEKAVETNLSLEKESGVPVKNDDNSSSYALPHKYYFIILVCIVVAGVVVVYRKRKVGRK